MQYQYYSNLEDKELNSQTVLSCTCALPNRVMAKGRGKVLGSHYLVFTLKPSLSFKTSVRRKRSACSLLPFQLEKDAITVETP